MAKRIIISDPHPRTLALIFEKNKFLKIKKKYKIISAPKKNKKIFYEKNISKAIFFIGQPDLATSLLQKASNLRAVFNVELNIS